MTDDTIYLITFKNGKQQRITVPSKWKVTFGPAVKGMNASKSSSLQVPMCLRFYEADTKQRAIFTDVSSFRDLSIKIEELTEHTQEKEGMMECDGVKKRTTFKAVVKEWKDPDDIGEQPVALPDPSDIKNFDVLAD